MNRRIAKIFIEVCLREVQNQNSYAIITCQKCFLMNSYITVHDVFLKSYQVPIPQLEKELRHRRLACELKGLQKEPLDGIKAVPLDKECNFFQALIKGPKGSPYEGGQFYLYLQVPKRSVYRDKLSHRHR